jgi:hypothetical protein
MVKQVARKSEAAARAEGLRRDSQGRLRIHHDLCRLGPRPALQPGQAGAGHHPARQKQQTLTLQVDSKHRLLEMEEIFPANAGAELADLDEEFAQNAAGGAEALRNPLTGEDFELDQKQMDELKQQMKQFKRQMEGLKAFGLGNRV